MPNDSRKGKGAILPYRSDFQRLGPVRAVAVLSVTGALAWLFVGALQSPDTTTARGPASMPPVGKRAPAPKEQQQQRLIPLKRLVGQRIVTRIAGTTADAELIARVRAGAVGGVILFKANIVTLAQVRALTTSLQRAAKQGGNPPLLIAVDQEGGAVRRMPSQPPASSPRQIAASERPTGAARTAGAATGAALHDVGINVDLAPVADVAVPGSFIRERAFGVNPPAVGERSCAFAAGLAEGGVVATLKHFPGLGRSKVSTDVAPVTIVAEQAQLLDDLLPYRLCGRSTLTMMSSARYPHLTGNLPAVMNPKAYALLRSTVGTRVVTMSDDLETPAMSQAGKEIVVRSVEAGLDLVLNGRTVSASEAAFDRLLEAARSRRLPRADLLKAYQAIVALKRKAFLG